MDDESVRNAEALEQRMVRALEKQPTVSIPADFAARVAAKVPARAKDSRKPRQTRYGYGMVWVGMVALLIAMLGFAPRAVAGSAIWVALEWTVCGQFVLLAIWFGVRRDWLK